MTELDPGRRIAGAQRRKCRAVVASMLTLFLGGCGNGALDCLRAAAMPWDTVALDAIFGAAERVTWVGSAVEITGLPQPNVAERYATLLGDELPPDYFDGERLYDLGPVNAAEVLEIEALNDGLALFAVYDADHVLLMEAPSYASLAVRDATGQRVRLTVPARRDSSACYLRMDLYFPAIAAPVLRITKSVSTGASGPSGAIVVLDFSGHAELTFRSGAIRPASVAPLEDTVARREAVTAFAEVFAPFNVQVLTGADPAPSGPYSRVYVGALDPPLSSPYYGYAEFLDPLNQTEDDVAVVDLNSTYFQMARIFGSRTYGRVIGRSAAHEVGHLLGLVHVADATAMMSTGCRGKGLSARGLLNLSTTWSRSPAIWWSDDTATWTLGVQDSERYLFDLLGPTGG